AFQAQPRTDPYVQNCCIRLLPRIPGVEAQVGMRVKDFGTRNPAIDQRPEPLPCHPVALAPSPQRTVPAPDYLGPKAVQTIHVAGHGMLVNLTLYYGPHPFPDFSDRLVTASPQLLFQLTELDRESFLNSLAFDDEAAGLAGLPTDMRETQKVE